MTLNKRYLRNIKHNLSFYICVVLLTLIAIVLYLAFSCGIQGERTYVDKFYDEQNVEDAQFVTANEIPEDEAQQLEQDYDLELERQTYLDVDLQEANASDRAGTEIADDYTIRIFRPAEQIDTYMPVEGRDIEADDEILLNPVFMEARKLSIGDTLTLFGTEYTIVGTLARPDYMTTYKNLTDNLFVHDAFGYGVISKDAFDACADTDKISYETVVYHDAEKEESFRKAVHDSYYTISYTPAESNVRINVASKEIEEVQIYTDVILPMFVLFVMVIIAIVLGRKIKSESRQIGVLSALGYGKGRLAAHYAVFGLIPGVIGVALGIPASFLCRDRLIQVLFENKLEKLPVTYTGTGAQMIYAALIPIICYGLVAAITALSVLRYKTVDLLHGSGGRKRHLRLRMAGLQASVGTKFRLRSLIGNWSRSLVVLAGIAIGGVLLVFCYVCVDSLKNYCAVSVDEVGDYEYEYFLNSIQTEPVADAAEIMTGSFCVDGYSTTLIYMGMDDNPYMALKDTDGNALSLTDGSCYISAMGAMIYGVEAGDELTFYDQASLQEYTVTIDRIVQNDSQSILYANRADACELLSVPDGSYNAVMSDHELSYQESEYIYRITKSELSDQINVVVENMESLLGPCIGFAVLIIVICVYLMVNMLISENASSISMLKVLGYENREINRMMINVYHLLVPVGIVLGSVLGVLACRANFEASVSAYNTYVETVYGPSGFVKYAVCVLVSYVGSLYLLGRKVKRTDMVESLKDNRE